MICPDCGCQRDDDESGPCACALDGFGNMGRGLVKPNPTMGHSMRALVHRKLERQRAEKAKRSP